MAFAIADRVFERIAFVGGTGAISLAVAAETDYQTFLSGWGASGSGFYGLVRRGAGQWETGLGTLNTDGTTLTRTTVYDGSSGAGVHVNFSAGTLDCFGDLPAARIVAFNESLGASIPGTTASTSPSSGALTVAGGLGVGGNIYAGGGSVQINSAGAGAVFFADGAGTAQWAIAKNASGFFTVTASGIADWIVVNRTVGNVQVLSTTASTSPTTGALTVVGGLGVAGAVYTSAVVSEASSTAGTYYFGDPANNYYLTFSGTRFALNGGGVNINDTTASSSPTTGALTVAGGLGVIDNVSVGGGAAGSTININNSSYTNVAFNNAAGAGVWAVGKDASGRFVVTASGIADWIVATASTGNVQILSTTASTSPSSGALTVAGGLGVAGSIYADAVYANNNVKKYGATGNGSTDDTAAMQAAHNTGLLIYYPQGNYKFSAIAIPSGGIVGDGPGNAGAAGISGTRLFTTINNVSVAAITWTGDQTNSNPPLFRDFSLQSTGATASPGILISPTSIDESAFGVFDNLLIHSMPVSIWFLAASNYVVTKCKFFYYATAALLVQNTSTPDSGDSSVSDCYFGPSNLTANSIWQHSSGGLKIVNNKFNGGSRGIFIDWNANLRTVDLLISNNSLENMADGAIVLARTASTGTFAGVTITGNQITVENNCIYVDTSGFVERLAISGNMLCTFTADATNIFVGNSRVFSIVGNSLLGNEGFAGPIIGGIGIQTGSGCTDAVVTGNSIVGYAIKTRLDGAVSSTRPVSVMAFGATGDFATDDTAAMQRAHDTGLLIYYPAGNYLFSTIHMAAGGIIGDGPGPASGGGVVGTRLFTTDNTSSGKITWTGSTGAVPSFRDFLLQSSEASVKAGSGIKIAPASDESSYGIFENIHITNIATGLHFERASHYSVCHCKFFGYTVAGVIVENLNVADSGDSTIHDCEFFGTSGNGIWQHSSGGLKVSQCKFLGGTRGYYFEATGAASTSIFLFSNNSVEAQTSGGVVFARTSGSNGFGKITITGCEFALDVTCIFVDSSGAFNNTTIAGNFFQIGSAGMTAIQIGTLSNFTIVGNTMEGFNSGDTGISTGGGSSNAKIGGNLITNFATPTSLSGTNISTTF